jgi:hypothetical protein
MHWHMCDRNIRAPMHPAYFVRETLEQVMAAHYKSCPCGLWDIIECDNLMCIVEAMT